MNNCRCNRDKDGKHYCHGNGYTCQNLGTKRFYNPNFVSLAGMQIKFQMKETIACDDCWKKFYGKS